MQTTFTKEFMQHNKGCYNLEQLNNCSFMKYDTITLDSIVESEIPIKDKYWFCCKKVFTKQQNQQISIQCAELVLHIYENKYPNDNIPRKAITAAKEYLNGSIDINELNRERFAAYAAAAAATTAAAYTTDAAAAFAAYAAAAATYATDAYAAYAAAAFAADDTLKYKLLILLKEFIKNNQ